MSIQVRSDYTSYALKITQNSQININHTPDKTSSASKSDAYVYDVSKTAEDLSKTNEVNVPFSVEELEYLSSVYLELGSDHPLWEDIGHLMNGGLEYKDRTNFLAVLSDAEGLTGDFVELVVDELGDEERSLFLSTARRNGSGQNLANIIDATKAFTEDPTSDRMMNFFETADTLGRTVESIKAGELQNFIAAVAESPASLEKIIEKVELLDEEDRALFLEGAALAGDELERFIDTADLLAGADLTRFLENAVQAGDGLSNLLTLTQTMTGNARSEFLQYTTTLTPENAELFLAATQGDQENVSELITTTQALNGTDREDFLTLAADAGTTLGRFTAMINKLEDAPGERSHFLSAALKAEGNFEKLVSVAEDLTFDIRANVLSFASNLSYTDLTNFISAAEADTSGAGALMETAEDLTGNDKSYLLYAASQDPDNIDALTHTAKALRGEQRENFLFTAANTAKQNPDGLEDYLKTVDNLSGTERKEFLEREKTISAGIDKESLDREYVHLNAVLDEDQMDTLLTAGVTMPDFEELVSEFNEMDGIQRETFLAVADIAGKEVLPDLMAVTSQLDEPRNDEFMNYAKTLGKKSLTDLVKASAQALNSGGEQTGGKQDFTTFDNLLETARSLNPAVDQDFLHAAAAAGDNLDKLIDLTNRIEGFMKADFLIAADNLADRPNAEYLMDSFLTTTDNLLAEADEFYNDHYGNMDEETREAYRPNTLFLDKEFKGRNVLEGYFASAAFMVGTGISDSDMNDWVQSWKGIPMPAGEELVV